jgi:hypothetical protein
MSQLQQNSPNETGSVRKPVLIVAVLIILLCSAAAVFFFKTTPVPEVPETEEPAPTVATEEPAKIPAAPARPVTPAATVRPATTPIKTTAPVDTKPARPEPTAYTQRIMDILSDIDPKTPMTPEKAALWKQSFEQLVKEGAAALPAIQQFLNENRDVKLGDNTNFLGETSLRTAMIKALDQIGGPEVIAFEAQWLQTATDPVEIAMLARQLDKQAPEQYRQQALQAAQAALSLASSGKLQDRDVGPLFGIVQQYGDAATVDYLKGLMNKWKYYGAIALSQLPDNAGVSALSDMVKETEQTQTRNIGFWMLAQSIDSDTAQSTLLEQAQKSTIPCPTWIEISSILAGNEFHFGSAELEKRLPKAGERSWKLNNGNQNFYSTPREQPYSAAQISRRVAVIQQLIAANKNCPEAVEWLQKALADLQGKVGT